MSKKTSIFSIPSKSSKTRIGTKANDSKKKPIPGSGKNRPAKGYNQETKTWNQS